MYRQHRTWMMAQNSHLASTGCSQRHQIVARRWIDRQLAPRSLLSLNMITQRHCSSIRTLSTFSRSRAANLELVWVLAWLPRTTRPLDSQLRHPMRDKHLVKGTIAMLRMAIQHLQASSMPSFNSNTSMTLTRRWHKLTTTLWLHRITWNSEEHIKVSELKVNRCHRARTYTEPIWTQGQTRSTRLASSTTDGHNQIQEPLVAQVLTRWLRPQPLCLSLLDWVRLPSRGPLVDQRERQTDLPPNKSPRLRGKVLVCKWAELKEMQANLHVTQLFRLKVVQLIKEQPAKSPEQASCKLTNQTVQPTLFTIKLLAQGQIWESMIQQL